MRDKFPFVTISQSLREAVGTPAILAPRQARTRWLRGVLEVSGGALAAAFATSAVTWPRGTLAGSGFSLMALFPLAVALSLASRVAQRWFMRVEVERVQRLGVYLRAVFVGATVFALSSWLCNLVLVEAALQSGPLRAYAASAAAGLLVGWQCTRNLHLRRVTSALPTWLMALLSALGLGLLDVYFYPQTFTRLHLGLLLASLALFSIAFANLSASAGTRSTIAGSLMAVAALTLICVFAVADRTSVYRSMLNSATSQQHVLMAARALSDGDGDSFGRWFGGGDCNDRDRSSFPLASAGTDCLGWATPGTAAAKADWPEARKAANAPAVVLLLTIDAFRCGFGRSEPLPELVSACPELAALADEGRLRLDAHTTAPRTDFAIGSLNTGQYRFEPASAKQFLGEWMARAGYRTHAISTAGNQFPRNIKETFQTVDVSLRSPRLSARAEAVTDTIIASLNNQPTGKPLFLWAHYFDVHAPYVATPGSSWALSSDLERYVGEVKRTDTAIGRLARALRASPLADQVVVFITADHGEEFGEKGAKYHGFSLNEVAVRIPMLVWTPKRDNLALAPAELPVSIAEVGSYLAAIVTGTAFVPAREAFFSSRSPNNTSFGIYRDGWKLIRHRDFAYSELYQLTNDPREATDRASRDLHVLNSLGRQMTAYTKGWPAHGTADEE